MSTMELRYHKIQMKKLNKNRYFKWSLKYNLTLEVHMDFDKALAQYKKMNNSLLNDKILIDDIVDSLRNFKYDDRAILTEVEEQIINAIYEEIRNVNPESLRKKYTNYFESTKFIPKTLPSDARYYRAREGNIIIDKNNLKEYNACFDIEIPYYGKQISAPAPSLCQLGRFNRGGTAYLYLSDNIKTCLCEIDAQVGTRCSIAQFKIKEPIKVLNLKATRFGVAHLLHRIFTKPVNKFNYNYYYVTEFFTECIKEAKKTYMGIEYLSTKGTGVNLVLFDSSNAELINYSERIVKVKKVYVNYEDYDDAISKYNKGQITKLPKSENSIERENLDYVENAIKHSSMYKD